MQAELKEAVSAYLEAGKGLQKCLDETYKQLLEQCQESAWDELGKLFGKAVTLAAEETGGDPEMAREFFEMF
jgi:hypothetical protein